MGIWWRHHIWISKKLKFDYLKNENSFWTAISHAYLGPWQISMIFSKQLLAVNYSMTEAVNFLLGANDRAENQTFFLSLWNNFAKQVKRDIGPTMEYLKVFSFHQPLNTFTTLKKKVNYWTSISKNFLIINFYNWSGNFI